MTNLTREFEEDSSNGLQLKYNKDTFKLAPTGASNEWRLNK